MNGPVRPSIAQSRARARARWALRTGALLLLAGCFSARPAARYFHLPLPEPPRHDGAPLPELAVTNLDAAAYLDQPRLIWRLSPVEYSHSRTLQWSTTPARMLTEGLRTYLARTGRFAAVTASPGAPYVLRGRLTALELDKGAGQAVLGLRLRLSAGDEVLWEEDVGGSRPVAADDPGEGVDALEALLGEAAAQITAEVVGVVQRHEAAGRSLAPEGTPAEPEGTPADAPAAAQPEGGAVPGSEP